MEKKDLVFVIDESGKYYGLPHISDLQSDMHTHALYYTELMKKILSTEADNYWAKHIKESMTPADSCFTIPHKIAHLGLITGYKICLDLVDGGHLCFITFPQRPSTKQLNKLSEIAPSLLDYNHVYYFKKPDDQRDYFGNDSSSSLIDYINAERSKIESSMEL